MEALLREWITNSIVVTFGLELLSLLSSTRLFILQRCFVDLIVALRSRKKKRLWKMKVEGLPKAILS